MNQPQAFTAADAALSLHCFREKSPLIHCLTNAVLLTFTTTVVLALGDFAAQVIEPEAVAQCSAVARLLNALYGLEIGT